MDHVKFRDALRRLDLKQVQAARLFGYDERSIRRWASGNKPVPKIVSLVLYLMLRFKVTLDATKVY